MSKTVKKTMKRVYRVVRNGFNEFGELLANPKPVAVPARFEKPESLEEQMARMVRSQLSAAMQSQGRDSFDEFDDFEEDSVSWDSEFVLTEVPALPPSPTTAEKPKVSQGKAANVDNGYVNRPPKAAPKSDNPAATAVTDDDEV